MTSGCEIGARQVQTDPPPSTKLPSEEQCEQAVHILRVHAWPVIGHDRMRIHDIKNDPSVVLIAHGQPINAVINQIDEHRI